MKKYSLHKSPGPLIRRVHQIGVSIFADEFRVLDITPLQYSIMWTLKQHSGIEQTTLAKLVALDRATCSNIVARLEAKGFISRAVNKENKRAKLTSLTKAGDALLEKAEKPMQVTQRKILQPLSAEERKVFLKCLAKLADSNNELSRAPMRFMPLK